MPPTALFVIDIQKSLADAPATEIPHAARIRRAGDALLSRARAANDSSKLRNEPAPVEVVVVQHEEDATKGDLVRGSKAWEVVFEPREGERLVSKDVRECGCPLHGSRADSLPQAAPSPPVPI